MPGLTPAGAGTFLDIGNSVQNFMGQQIQNAESRKWSEKMYQRQYDDNLALWRLQNDYNSPAAQMQRYQDAGLNPNLIYGQSNTAGSIQAPSPQPAQFRSTDMSFQNPLAQISAIYDLDIKKQTVDNLKAQNTIYMEDALLKRAQTDSLTAGTDLRRFDLDYKKENRPFSLQYDREKLRQIKSKIDIDIQENARRAVLVSNTLKESAARMANMLVQQAHTKADTQRIYSTMRNLEKQGTLYDLEIALKRTGLTWSDPLYQRIASIALSRHFENQMSQGFEKGGIKGAGFEEYFQMNRSRQFRHQ